MGLRSVFLMGLSLLLGSGVASANSCESDFAQSFLPPPSAVANSDYRIVQLGRTRCIDSEIEELRTQRERYDWPQGEKEEVEKSEKPKKSEQVIDSDDSEGNMETEAGNTETLDLSTEQVSKMIQQYFAVTGL